MKMKTTHATQTQTLMIPKILIATKMTTKKIVVSVAVKIAPLEGARTVLILIVTVKIVWAAPTKSVLHTWI
jgi:hypothetical protein